MIKQFLHLFYSSGFSKGVVSLAIPVFRVLRRQSISIINENYYLNFKILFQSCFYVNWNLKDSLHYEVDCSLHAWFNTHKESSAMVACAAYTNTSSKFTYHCKTFCSNKLDAMCSTPTRPLVII